MSNKFCMPLSGDRFRQVLPVVKIIDPPVMIFRGAASVECSTAAKCPICDYFAEMMVESILRQKNLVETLDVVAKFASRSPKDQLAITKKLEERLG